jgi:hypothetical protein
VTDASHQADAVRRQPERTCLGCRRTADSSQLLRLVRSPDGEVVYDAGRRLGGRGAWVCRSAACLTRALGSRRLGTAVGGPVNAVRPEVMLERISGQVRRRVEGLLAAAGKARKVELGATRVEDALRRTAGVRLVVLARDLSPRVAASLGAHALAAHAPIAWYGDRSTLGALFARDELGVAALMDDGLARAVRYELSLLDGLTAASTEIHDLPVGGFGQGSRKGD